MCFDFDAEPPLLPPELAPIAGGAAAELLELTSADRTRFYAAMNESLDLAGVVGFYGGLSRSRGGSAPVLERVQEIGRPVLGLFGGADQSITPEDVEAFDRGLDAAGVEHEVISYPGAPHSFFDRKQAEHADASTDAWRRVLDFLRRMS